MLFVRMSRQHSRPSKSKQWTLGATSNLLMMIDSCIATSTHESIPEDDNVKDLMKPIDIKFEFSYKELAKP